MSTGRLSGNSPCVLFWGVPPSPAAVLQAGCLDRSSCRQVVWKGQAWYGAFASHRQIPRKFQEKNTIGATLFTGRKNAFCPQIRDFHRKCSTLRESHKIRYLYISVANQYPEAGSYWVVLLLRHSDLQTNAQLECKERSFTD